VYHKRPDEPATQVAILRGLVEDLYVTMGKHDLDEGTAALKLVSNPLVDWMWLGFLLMAAATALVLLPNGRKASAVPYARLSSSGVTITLVGAAAALVFGLVVARLPWGAPLAILSVGGLILGLTALALYRVLDPLLRHEATTSAERRTLIEEELRARTQSATETAE
jgi:hypothetical protein